MINKEYQQQWYIENKDRVRLQHKEYYQKNKSKWKGKHNKEYMRLWRSQNKEHINTKARLWYNKKKQDPIWAAKHKLYWQEQREKNREKIKVNSKKRYLLSRFNTLSYYSGGEPICACCKEKQIKFLSIDHINGGGSKERKAANYGGDIYNWLRRRGYPVGYRVLCHNCNMASGFYGQCPHVTIRE